MREREMRAALRVAVLFQVRIRAEGIPGSFYGQCTDLSVTGMTVQTSFVPQAGEMLEVRAIQPGVGKGAARIFAARVQVMRCHELETGKLYELGLRIEEVLQ
jgi:hypothetical protein